jgi:hypothetical protein
LAEPPLTERIARELRGVEKGRYETDECRNAALGQVIEALGSFHAEIEDRMPLLQWVRRQRKNTRDAARRKAVLAPSSHNTQPWVFRIGASEIDLFADRTRALPVNEPEDRELTIRCGAGFPQILLRFGYPEGKVPESPRRPVEDVIEWTT